MSAARSFGWRSHLAATVRRIQTLEDSELHVLHPWARYLLAPALQSLSGAYAASQGVREWLSSAGLLRAASVPCPLVSVRTLALSGTGKTPFVEFLARHYAQSHGLRSMILQAGGGTVDEAPMLRSVLQGLPVTVAEAGPWLLDAQARGEDALQAAPDTRLVILDGGGAGAGAGRVRSDLDVVMVNALTPFGNGHLWPRGPLRERPRAALRRADVVVLHHADLAGPEAVRAAHAALRASAPSHALFVHTCMAPLGLRSLSPALPSLDMSDEGAAGEALSLSRLRGARVVCLTGIGAPETLERHLGALGATSVEGVGGEIPDHHMFGLDDVERAVARVRQLAAAPGDAHACLLVTEKDYARQRGLYDAVFGRMGEQLAGGGARGAGWGAYVLQSGLEVVEADTRFSSPRAVFAAMLRMALDKFRTRSFLA